MHNTPIGEIMTSDVKAIQELEILQEVVAILASLNIHHVPVVDKNDKVVGIISRTDIDQIKTGASLFKNHQKEELNEIILRTKWVSEVMTKEVICLQVNDSVQDAYQIFKENLFHAIPILEDEKLVGIVTPIDIIDFLINTFY